MKLYSYPVTIYATAYVVAESDEQADKLLFANLHDASLEFPQSRAQYGDVIVTGERYSLKMPQVSLSPAMTIAEVEPNAGEFVEELTD